MTACNSEQAAAVVLGYNQVSWDNESGREKQPWAYEKPWIALREDEKAAAALLGYTETIWDNKSGLEAQPASGDKKWAELTACGTRD